MAGNITGNVVLDTDGSYWEKQIDLMLAGESVVIALRGAGSFNGIAVDDASSLAAWINIEIASMIARNQNVTIIFDGDNDDPEYPDIGNIAARIRDHFGNGICFYAVQTLGWYKYRSELPRMRPLHTACGNKYHTVLFPDNVFPGAHDHFSQNARLARSSKYQQWYVGACGEIALKQLADYSEKAGDSPGPHRAVIFRAQVSKAQEDKVRRKIDENIRTIASLAAQVSMGVDAAIKRSFELEQQTQRLSGALVRRAEHPYGLLCDKDGTFINKPYYRNLELAIA
jgi:hypothetical protein